MSASDGIAEELKRARALPAPYYVGDDMLARDRAQVLSRSWQLVAHRDRLAGPGDHVVDQVGRTPVLVVRGADGVLRAFPNVCRHRAGPLAIADGRGARQLQCKYHGWTYDLEGRLRRAPEMNDAKDFRVADICLPPLRVGEWQGLVFVALGEDVPPLEKVMGGIAERIAPVDLAAMRFARRDSYELACNWKVYVDNYLEGYHLPYVHPGLTRMLDYRVYATELSEWHSLQHAPIASADSPYGDGEAFYYFVYPNTMLNIMPGRLQVNRVLPTAAERCRVEFDYYYADDPGTQARIARDGEFSEAVQQEDIAICEAVQRGLGSGTYQPGRLCPQREAGVWHFHKLLRAACGDPAEETR